jgi:CBS domain-containing protein
VGISKNSPPPRSWRSTLSLLVRRLIDKSNRLLGVVSEHDLLKAIMEGKDLKGTTAGEVMTKGPVSVTWDTKIEGIARLMLKKKFIRVPIVVPGERGENLVGIVARRDLIFSYLKAQGYESFEEQI